MSPRALRRRLDELTGNGPVLPLGLLFALNASDEFDRLAFGILAPEIRDTFGLTDAGIVLVSALPSLMILTAGLPIGFLVDRVNRVRLITVVAFVWAAATFGTSVAPVLAVLIVTRLLSGIAKVTNDPAHASLLTDIYPIRTHPRIFAAWRAADPASGLVGLAVGVLGARLGWRPTFALVAIPAVIVAVLLRKVREPARGQTRDAALATELADEPPQSFWEARRELFLSKTLRRMWAGFFVLGLAVAPLSAIVALFFEQVFRFGPALRGLVSSASGLGAVVGLIAGGHLAGRIVSSERYARLAITAGLALAWLGVAFVGMAIAPIPDLSLLALFLGVAGLNICSPSFLSLIGLVSPPRIRGQAYAWGGMFLGFGLLNSFFIANLGENLGYRPALAVLGGIVAVSGFLVASAHKFVEDDQRAAAGNLVALKEFRDLRARYQDQALLVCRDVQVAYDDVQVLFGVDLEVHKGEIVALLGTNGAGKSTLLNAISGVISPFRGVIYFDGHEITHADANRTSHLGLIEVVGGRSIFPTLTVAEHLRAACWRYRRDPAAARRASEEALVTFPILRERWHQKAGNLSGGEQQMLAIGMALISRPKLFMIDELSLGLAPTIVTQLLDIVRRIRDNGTAVLVVEQSVNVALTLADRAYFLEKGEVRFSGPTAELVDRKDIVRSVFLEKALTEGSPRIRTRPASDAVAGNGTKPLEVDGLTKRFGGITAANNVSLSVSDREIVGLIGANGAGKTTVLDLVSGFLEPDSGWVKLGGREITNEPAHRRGLAGLGRSFQDARLIGSLTVAENLALGFEPHLELRDHLAGLLALPDAVEQERNVAWSVGDLVELMGLGAFRDKFVRELSTGSRRIVELAKIIGQDPDVLLLDEPSSGIAQRETEALGPLLLRVQDEVGCAMVVVEHDMALITSIADRLIALDLGTVIANGRPEDVVRNPAVVRAYLGTDTVAISRSHKARSPDGGA